MNLRAAGDAALHWHTLTPASQRAMLDPAAAMHPNTRRCLQRRGLLEHQEVTELGQMVVRHRPARVGPVTWLRSSSKPIVNVHLPEAVPA